MRSTLIAALTALVVILVMVYQARTIAPRLCDEHFTRLGEIAGFTSEKIEPSEKELETLPKDTLFDKRHYKAPDGTWYQVSLVIGGVSKSSIHRPELCIPSQGYQMHSPHTIDVAGIDWRIIRLERGLERPIGFAYTFYNQVGFHTSSHIRRIFCDVWDRSIFNRIDRWAMLTVNSSRTDDRGLEEFLLKLKEVAR